MCVCVGVCVSVSVCLSMFRGLSDGSRGPALPSGAPSVEGKAASAALSTVLLEAARLNAPSAAVKSALAENSVPSGLASEIAKAYAGNVDAIRALHATDAVALPSLVDADWKLDYVVKSSDGVSNNEPVYTVQLTFAATGAGAAPAVLRHHRFAASPAQLQDLLHTVAQATQAAKSLGAS